MVWKWQQEWVVAQTIQICDVGTVVEKTSLLLTLELALVKEPMPTVLEMETSLK
jgi:hypothetical protein